MRRALHIGLVLATPFLAVAGVALFLRFVELVTGVEIDPVLKAVMCVMVAAFAGAAAVIL